MAVLTAKMSKIEEASRKKDEQTSQFITATKEALDQKMGLHVEKREAYITDLKSKLKVKSFIQKSLLRHLFVTSVVRIKCFVLWLSPSSRPKLST